MGDRQENNNVSLFKSDAINTPKNRPRVRAKVGPKHEPTLIQRALCGARHCQGQLLLAANGVSTLIRDDSHNGGRAQHGSVTDNRVHVCGHGGRQGPLGCKIQKVASCKIIVGVEVS